jgi:hypothetical protein
MLKKLYVFFLLVVGLASSQPVSAQRGRVFQSIGAEDDTEFTLEPTAPLHILLPEALSEQELKGNYLVPASRTEYLAQIAAHRSALEAAAKHWHLSPVKFITEAEYNRLTEDKQNKHLVLYFGFKVFRTERSSLSIPALELCLIGKVGSRSTLFGKRDYEWQLLAYQLFNTSTKLFLVSRWPAWQAMFHTSDAISTVQQMQLFLEQRLKGQKPRDIDRAVAARLGQSTALLQTKTLLLAREQVAPKLAESKLKQAYPYPVQLTDRAAVEAAVASGDARYLYLRYVTLNGGNGFQLLEASSGQVVGYAEVNSSRSGHPTEAEASDLKELVATATKK